MKIQIGYFAILREQTQVPSEFWETDAKTPREVFQEVSLHYGLTLKEEQVKVAVNNKFSSFDEPLKDGDKLVFIPPVAGG